ncbi:hypothetical protein EUX98_g6030 [Antrodiella citrinella]|uniref:Uncharacterized protein n=1 Tax=Antrodiella citrinella TaxID=2447956 RepID=A0A4S4MRW7_9APHY|nr:hypothetical protein EUX98_g6030 [Antrodiella citrinella]
MQLVTHGSLHELELKLDSDRPMFLDTIEVAIFPPLSAINSLHTLHLRVRWVLSWVALLSTADDGLFILAALPHIPPTVRSLQITLVVPGEIWGIDDYVSFLREEKFQAGLRALKKLELTELKVEVTPELSVLPSLVVVKNIKKEILGALGDCGLLVR